MARRDMFEFTEVEVKKLCIELLGSFTNTEELISNGGDIEEDFYIWFKQNKNKFKNKNS